MAKRRLNQRQIARIKASQQRRRERAAERRADDAVDVSTQSLGPEQTGLVIANYGPALIVEPEANNSQLYRCAVRQHLGTVVCGDRVIWQASTASEGEGVVIALTARRSLLTRPDYGGNIKPVAANIDQVAIVIAPEPPPAESLIDRYLVTVETLGMAALLVLNKADLLTTQGVSALTPEYLARFDDYRHIGYRVISASSRSADGLTALRQQLRGQVSVLVGQSGVGKSSLTQALLPEQDIRVQALSSATGLGTHTTTTSMLYHLPDGGVLIDSPGVRSFEPTIQTLAALENGFIEFRPFLGHCRFSDCSHAVEPDCALRAAAQAGQISARRLASFQQMRQSVI